MNYQGSNRLLRPSLRTRVEHKWDSWPLKRHGHCFHDCSVTRFFGGSNHSESSCYSGLEGFRVLAVGAHCQCGNLTNALDIGSPVDILEVQIATVCLQRQSARK